MINNNNIEFKTGLIPSPIDNRDYLAKAIIPAEIELEDKFCWSVPTIRDQGKHGLCVGFAGAGTKNIQEINDNNYVDGGFSPLFLYTLCKQIDGIPNEEGTYVRSALKSLKNVGIIPENDIPYSLLIDVKKLPEITEDQKIKASDYKISTYAQVDKTNINEIKKAIKISPAMAGVLVCSNFINSEQGFIDSPAGTIMGGHAIYFAGWDDNLTYTFANGKTKKGFFIFANSWSEKWGDKGFGYIAYEDMNWQSDMGMPFIYEIWSCLDVITNPKPDNPKEEDKKEEQKYWKVQLYAFAEKSNAQKAVEKLKSQGFPTYLPPRNENGHFTIQIGAFKNKENGDKLADTLKRYGYNPWVKYC